jgi:hypothetical protein
MSTPQPEDGCQNEVWTDSSNAILITIDGPWDTTVRPRPPHIPPYSPHAIPPGLWRHHQAPPPEEQRNDARAGGPERSTPEARAVYKEGVMFPQPVALGLTLCEQILVDKSTNNFSLINIFTSWPTKKLPSPPRRLCLYAILKGGQGRGIIELSITREDTDEVIFSVRKPVDFPDRLSEIRVFARDEECSFPALGWYNATLSIDGDWVAQRRFRVIKVGGKS